MSILCCAAVWRSRRWPEDKVSALTCTADHRTFAFKYRTSAGGSWRTFRTFSPIFWKSASYVYAADSAISRGGKTDTQMGRRWRRKFRFEIPVRLPGLWSSDPVLSALVETLGFLSEDSYEFEFREIIDAPTMAEYFEFKDKAKTAFTPDEVILFSGGLDSLSGTLEELVGDGKRGCARKSSFRKQDRWSAEGPCGQATQPVRRQTCAPCSRVGKISMAASAGSRPTGHGLFFSRRSGSSPQECSVATASVFSRMAWSA